MRMDGVIDQAYESYTDEDHAVWRALYNRQTALLPGRVCKEFMGGLKTLAIAEDGIPEFSRLSDALELLTGWRIVAVPGLIQEEIFFAHLAARRFPVTNWIRKRESMDYLQEPDVFHDLFGHVPLLTNPFFADYMAAYGRGGLKALGLGALDMLARLYWYTVEFGLIDTPDGLRIFGAGIASSKGESLYCLDDPAPNRIRFDLKRILRSRYRIDDFQETYFVIESFDALVNATIPDFTPIYDEVRNLDEIPAGALVPEDRSFKT